MSEVEKVSVTVLTGFLGAGKTTLLNRILSEKHGLRIAVVENEFGEIGIDGDLVVGADEEIVQVTNGCLCCTVRGDLIKALHQLLQRREQFDRIIIESSGLADPGPLLQTFYLEPQLREHCAVDGVVTLVDAKHIRLYLDGDAAAPGVREAREQIAFADLIVLNKTDLVETDELDALTQRIADINAMAPTIRARQAAVPIERVIDVGGFDLERALRFAPDLLSSHLSGSPSHDHAISSVGVELDGDMNGPLLYRWIGDLLVFQGRGIFRMKGVIAIAGAKRELVFQGVHTLIDASEGRRWEDRRRCSRIVFIGRDLDRAALEGGFRDCLATRVALSARGS